MLLSVAGRTSCVCTPLLYHQNEIGIPKVIFWVLQWRGNHMVTNLNYRGKWFKTFQFNFWRNSFAALIVCCLEFLGNRMTPWESLAGHLHFIFIHYVLKHCWVLILAQLSKKSTRNGPILDWLQVMLDYPNLSGRDCRTK